MNNAMNEQQPPIIDDSGDFDDSPPKKRSYRAQKTARSKAMSKAMNNYWKLVREGKRAKPKKRLCQIFFHFKHLYFHVRFIEGALTVRCVGSGTTVILTPAILGQLWIDQRQQEMGFYRQPKPAQAPPDTCQDACDS